MGVDVLCTLSNAVDVHNWVTPISMVTIVTQVCVLGEERALGEETGFVIELWGRA
jgi:hypothetical protein